MVNEIFTKIYKMAWRWEEWPICSFNFFKVVVDMILIVFVDSYIPQRLLISQIWWPHPFNQQLHFWRFLTFFIYIALISLFSQHNNVMLTKSLENLFHVLEIPQSKYHLIWTLRSKENRIYLRKFTFHLRKYSVTEIILVMSRAACFLSNRYKLRSMILIESLNAKTDSR